MLDNTKSNAARIPCGKCGGCLLYTSTVNETLLNAYRADQSPKTTYEHLGESTASVYTADVLASFKDTEVAIVMFARMAGESHDLLPEYKDSDGAIIGMLELSANEREIGRAHV